MTFETGVRGVHACDLAYSHPVVDKMHLLLLLVDFFILVGIVASNGLGLSHVLATGLQTVGQEVVLGQHLFMDCAQVLDQTFRVVESCLQIDTF